jgi:hypothetical protein
MSASLKQLLILGFLSLLGVENANAQEHPRKWVLRGEVGLIGQPEAFDPWSWEITDQGSTYGAGDRCRVDVVEHLGVGVGRRISRWLHVHGVLALQAAAPGCASPAIQTQDAVLGYYVGRTVGNDYFSTEVRAVFERGSATVRPRALLGIGWIPKKHVPSVAIGGGFSAGKLGARFVSELAAQVTRIRWTREFTCYGNCGTRTGMYWTESGTYTSLKPYVRIGVEF